MGECMKQDNRGVSLVEILIVVSIITVLAGVGIYGVSLMSGQPAKQCAQKIMYSLERHRTTAMSKVEAKYVLEEENGKVYFREYVVDGAVKAADGGTWILKSEAEVGSSGVEVVYTVDADPTPQPLPLELRFNRSSGAFEPLTVGKYCTHIIAERGGKEFKLTLVPLTGKVYID